MTRPERITIAPDVRESLAVSGGCYIQGINGIFIGEGTLIAPGAKIISGDQDLTDYGTSADAPPIRIGKRCWLAANCVILPGVTLGDRTVVGAGAVVTRSMPGNCVVAGVPARVVRALDGEQAAPRDRI